MSAIAGHKDELLFHRGTQQTWQWAKGCPFIRWFTDGEHRYAKALWDLASVYLALRECPSRYRTRKVWRPGGSDESQRVSRSAAGRLGEARASLHRISPLADVHANHNEAHNAALRRRCSAYRRRQNLYAKTQDGLQRALDVQRILHNWVRPHWGLGKQMTPAMAIGLCHRPLSTQELLCIRGFQCISS